MSDEKKRLVKMLKENKISESDFKLLTETLSKKSPFNNIEKISLFNPFQKIAGYKALIIGLMIMVGMSILGPIANMHFDGIFSSTFAMGIQTKVHSSFLLALYQNLVNCIVLATLYYIAALVCGQKGIRIIDFYGTVALSRYPYLVLVGFFAILYSTCPAYFNIDVSKGYDLHPTIIGSLSNFFWVTCYVWQMITYFFAFKESSGLEGKRFWISFIIMTFLLGDMIAMLLTRMPLYM